MDWINEIIKKHTKEDGTVDLDKAMDEIKQEFPKNAVPKETFNQKNEDLKAANKLVEELKKDNKDAEDLQDKIKDYETKVEILEKERLEERKSYTLKEKLKEVGAKDIDYMIYKLGELEVDEDGNIKDLDNKIKSLQEEHKSHFEALEPKDDGKEGGQEPGKGQDDKGYKVLDNGLEDGKEPDQATKITTEFEEALGI